MSRPRGEEKSPPVPTVDVDRENIALDILAVVGLEAGRNLRPPGALIHAGRFLPPHGRLPVSPPAPSGALLFCWGSHEMIETDAVERAASKLQDGLCKFAGR